jgi:nitrite reductase/ring-hydroxylating ferredoxin subunit
MPLASMHEINRNGARMTEPSYQHAIAAAAVPEGQTQAVALGGREIIVCHTREGWHALDNICSHAHARMSEGRLRGFRLICPLHGASFDCRTGAVLGAPAITPLKSYPVRVVGDQIEIAL